VCANQFSLWIKPVLFLPLCRWFMVHLLPPMWNFPIVMLVNCSPGGTKSWWTVPSQSKTITSLLSTFSLTCRDVYGCGEAGLYFERTATAVWYLGVTVNPGFVSCSDCQEKVLAVSDLIQQFWQTVPMFQVG